jgi:integrase
MHRLCQRVPATETGSPHQFNQEDVMHDAARALITWGEWNEHGLVFCDAVGEPLSLPNETKRFQRAVAAAGLPAIRFHDLRHTAATILLAKGVHVKLVSEMLGHSTITLTLDTYSHVIPAMHGDAAAAMDAVFSA